MIPKEKGSRGRNNVTNLADVRRAKAMAGSTSDEHDSLSVDELSNEATDYPHGNRRFDAEKVARIKAAIAAGEYKIDASRVADKFIEAAVLVTTSSSAAAIAFHAVLAQLFTQRYTCPHPL